MLSVRYLDPTTRTFDESVLGWLLREVPDASTVRLATGYFEASVLDWLEDPLEALLQRGGSVHALIGSNSGQTGRADLERLRRVLTSGPGGTLHVEYAEGGIFHPKVFVVESPTRAAAVIGSANLTTNGSLVNVEAGVVLDTDQPGPPPESPIDAVIASIDPAQRPDVFAIATTDDLDRLEKLGVIGRVVRTAPANLTQTQADRQREGRRGAGVRTRPGVTGIPARTRRRAAGARRASPAAPPPTSGDFYGLRFAPNDLKTTGTREFSVSGSMRDWAETVLGRSLNPGEGTLFSVAIEGRLATAPMSIASTIEPVRLWATGGSGGNHADVRLVLGNRLRTELEDEAIRLTGLPIPGGSIGVFQLPVDPRADPSNPARLTVFLPTDPAFAAVESLLGRTGRERKLHFRVPSLPQMPPWP